MVSQSELEAAIRDKVQHVSALVVNDVSGGCGQAYDVIIVSEAFSGLNTLKRHRLVNDVLKEQIAQLHAFSQKTYTPDEYQRLSSQQQQEYAQNSAAETSAATNSQAQQVQSQQTLSPSAGIKPARPSTLDTSVAQRGAKVHHRSTSSNISVPELVLTPDGGDVKDGPTKSGAQAGHHARQRSLTPNNIAELIGEQSAQSSPGSGISRRHYQQITSVEFWTELRELLERRFVHQPAAAAAAAAADSSIVSDVSSNGGGVATGTSSPGLASPISSSKRLSRSGGGRSGESELTKIFEDFFATQKQHMSASDAARVRDGTGMFGM